MPPPEGGGGRGGGSPQRPWQGASPQGRRPASLHQRDKAKADNPQAEESNDAHRDKASQKYDPMIQTVILSLQNARTSAEAIAANQRAVLV